MPNQAMQDFYDHAFNADTKVQVPDIPPFPISAVPSYIDRVINTNLRIIQTNILQNRMMPPTINSTFLFFAKDTNQDITRSSTFEGSSFEGITKFKTDNIFDTKLFSAACTDFLITPTMIRIHSIEELFNYALNIRKFPDYLIDLFPNGQILLSHDYYENFLRLYYRHRYRTP